MTTSSIKELSPRVLLSCGILEEYHDAEFTNYYGHPKEWKRIEPLIIEWNNRFIDKPERQISLNYYEGKKILTDVLEYADNLANARKEGISLFLSGSNGSGKTHLATSVLKHAIRCGFTAQMTSLGGLVQAYADGWSSRENREKFDNRIRNVDFLLIDDVAKEYQPRENDLTAVVFDNLVRYRVFRRKPFILTSNVALDTIETRYGKSLRSLITGKTIGVKMIGDDYREKIQGKSLKERLLGTN